MRIAIIGIGGVGGYFGGKLAREFADCRQHEIVFICRGEHLAAIKKDGLKLYTKGGDYVVCPSLATDNLQEAGIFDLVFFCTKSYHLEKTALAIAGNISKNTIVIPLLNGVDIAERLYKILPGVRILRGCVYISSAIEKPGVVRQTEGTCKLVFGTDDQSSKNYQFILDILLQAKINAELTGKISTALWTKYLLICPLAGLTAATGKTFGGIMESPDLRGRLEEMIKEVKLIADARQIVLPEDIVEQILEKIGSFAYNTKTSMQIDLERGNQTEIDIFTAYIRQSGVELGISTPLHNQMFDRLKNCLLPP
ncbi:MAG: ketopantoate reductase family protein [Smithellaceae bacterium]